MRRYEAEKAAWIARHFISTARVAPEKADFRPALPSILHAGLQPEKSMANKISWSQQYKHPMWQRKRLEAMEHYGFECQNCGDKETTLNVHHVRYVKRRMVWEYGVEELTVLCEPCHETEHEDKELLNRLVMEIGPGALRQAACLLGGYHDAQCSLEPGVGEMVRQTDGLYYELGMAACCLESMGIEEWRGVVRRRVAQGPSSPTMKSAVEAWDEAGGAGK